MTEPSQETALAMAELVATVRQLKDRADIGEVMHTYCRLADNMDGRAMAALFVDDCQAIYEPASGTVYRGREELIGMLTGALADVVSGSHHITNVELTFDGSNAAILACYMYSWQRFESYPTKSDCHRWGRYECRFLRTAAGWRIHRLVLLSAGEYGAPRIGEQIGRSYPPTFG